MERHLQDVSLVLTLELEHRKLAADQVATPFEYFLHLFEVAASNDCIDLVLLQLFLSHCGDHALSEKSLSEGGLQDVQSASLLKLVAVRLPDEKCCPLSGDFLVTDELRSCPELRRGGGGASLPDLEGEAGALAVLVPDAAGEEARGYVVPVHPGDSLRVEPQELGEDPLLDDAVVSHCCQRVVLVSRACRLQVGPVPRQEGVFLQVPRLPPQEHVQSAEFVVAVAVEVPVATDL